MKKGDARDSHDFRYVTKMVTNERSCGQCEFFEDCVDCKRSDPVCDNFKERYAK